MTVAVILAGLLPILWGGSTGSEVMSRIAAPMIGGMFSAPPLSVFVVWVDSGREHVAAKPIVGGHAGLDLWCADSAHKGSLFGPQFDARKQALGSVVNVPGHTL